SPYRRADPDLRATPRGRRSIYHRALDAHPDAIMLTGTRTPLHLRENACHVATWAGSPSLEIEHVCGSSSLPPGLGAQAAAGLRAYFACFARPAVSGSWPRLSGEGNVLARGAIDDTTTAIARVLLGSRKTRLGALPPPRSREVLRERIRHKVADGLPIEAILTWGPRKFYAEGRDDVSDVAEAVALERLFDLHRLVAGVYPPGLHVTIFLEDFEGQFIEGISSASFDPYIESLEALIRTVGIGDAVVLIRTSALLGRASPRFVEATGQLETNYAALRAYWRESETGAGGPAERDSLKVLEDLGFAGPITA